MHRSRKAWAKHQTPDAPQSFVAFLRVWHATGPDSPFSVFQGFTGLNRTQQGGMGSNGGQGVSSWGVQGIWAEGSKP